MSLRRDQEVRFLLSIWHFRLRHNIEQIGQRVNYYVACGGADVSALRLESERQWDGAQQTYIVLPISDSDHIL